MHSWEDKHVQQKQIVVYKSKKTSQVKCSEQQSCCWVSLTTGGEVTQHEWQSLCAEWLWSQASGLVRGKWWEQKNIPCGPWGRWDAVTLLLIVYLHTGLAYASQTWRKPTAGLVRLCSMAVCEHVYRILRMQPQSQTRFHSAPAWLRRCWNSLDIYWSAQRQRYLR